MEGVCIGNQVHKITLIGHEQGVSGYFTRLYIYVRSQSKYMYWKLHDKMQ